jgi:DNA-binding NtrC family response regulator
MAKRYPAKRLQELLADVAPLPRMFTERSPLLIHVGTSLHDAEREIILNTLLAFGGNKQRAAEVLGTSRRTMYNKLARYERASRTRRSAR